MPSMHAINEGGGGCRLSREVHESSVRVVTYSIAPNEGYEAYEFIAVFQHPHAGVWPCIEIIHVQYSFYVSQTVLMEDISRQ